MKKATEKNKPVSLGTKRSCPKCGTKFYDFNREEISCPKCESKLDPEALNPLARITESRRSKVEKNVAPQPADDVAEEGEVIESVDELAGDDDEDVVEEIDVDDDEDEEGF